MRLWALGDLDEIIRANPFGEGLLDGFGVQARVDFAGADGFIFVGCDVIATLSELLGGQP